MHKNRLILAAILLPILYLLITFLPPFAFFLLVAAAILLAQWEFYKFYYTQPAPIVYWGLASGFLITCHFYRTTPWPFLFLVVLILMTLLLVRLFSCRPTESALQDIAVLFTGVFYPVCFLGHLVAIRRMGEGGVGFILFLLVVVWGGDAGAYYTGRAIGGKKLYPSVSPNKTVSGAIGGFLVSLLGSALVKLGFPLFPLTWGETAFVALLLAGIGQCGDLVESLFKRSAGVKDSSGLIFAHGGILDKLDGVAFAAPVLYYYLLWAHS